MVNEKLLKFYNIASPIIVILLLVSVVILLFGAQGTLDTSERDAIEMNCIIIGIVCIVLVIIHFIVNFIYFWRNGTVNNNKIVTPVQPTISTTTSTS